MADIQTLLNQAVSSTTPRTPVVDVLANKRAEIEQATLAKRDELIKASGELGIDMYQVAAGLGNQAGAASMSEPEKDLRTLSSTDLILKYGPDVASRLRASLGNAQVNFHQDKTAQRGLGEAAYDSASGAVSSAALGLADVAAWGGGIVNEDLGAWGSNLVEQGREAVASTQSDALAARQRANQAVNSLDYRDNEAQYQKDIKDGVSSFEANLDRYGSDIIDTWNNTNDDMVIGQGISEALGSVASGGVLAKGVRKSAELLTKSLKAAGPSKLASRIDNAADFAAWPAATAALEGGSAYTGTVNKVMSMSHEELMANSPMYPSIYQNLLLKGVSPDEAKEAAKTEVADEAGMRAAPAQAAVGAVTGLLTRYAETPFKVKSPGSAIRNIAINEPGEEFIQGGSGAVAQNLAIQATADRTQSASEGAGEGSTLGAMYGAGVAGTLQGPGLAKDAAVSSTKAVVGAATKGLTSLAERDTNAKNAALDAEAVQAADELAATPVPTETIDSTELPDEEKAKIKDAASVIDEALSFDPTSGDLTNYPENLKAAVQNSTNRTNAIIQVAGEASKAQSGMELLQIGAALTELLAPFDALKDKDNTALASLPDDHLSKIRYQKALAHIESMRNLPSVEKAMGAVQAYIDQHAADMAPVSEEALATPEGQQQIQDVVTVATISPNKGNLDTVTRTLEHFEKGKIPLTETQVRALENSRALLTAEKEIADRKAKNPLKQFRDVVANEIITRDEGLKERGKYSALEFVNRIQQAAVSNPELSKAYLEEFGMFVQHMKNKVDALNTHYENGAKQGILNRDKEDYDALLPASTAGREGFAKAKSLGWEGVQVSPTSENSIDLAQSIELEGKILADIYNSLVDSFGYAGVNRIEASQLDAEITGKAPKQIVADFKNKLKAKPEPKKPEQQTQAESVPAKETFSIEQAVSSANNRFAQGKDAASFEKIAQDLRDKGNPKAADAFMAEYERLKDQAAQDLLSEQSSQQQSQPQDDEYQQQDSNTEDSFEETSTSTTEPVVRDEASSEFDESSLDDVFTTEEPALIEQKHKLILKEGTTFDLNNGQKNAFQLVMGFLKGRTQIFSIIGSAGTGKTTIVDTVLASLGANGLAGKNIILASPTHRANGVTRSKNDPGLEIVTLHNLLGLLPPEDKLPGEEKLKDTSGFRQRVNQDGEEVNSITNRSLIIIDEASMINDGLFSALMRALQNYPGAKVIFLGDAAQLKPVGQSAVSKALESDAVNETNRAELTKVERAKNASLLAESVRLRKNKDFTKTTRMTKTGQGVAFTRSTTNFVEKFVEYLKSDEFKENPLLARIVAFSNNRVKEYNQKIREQLFGKGAAPFVVGELLMGYKTYGDPDLITKLATINNGLDYLVTDVSEDVDVNYLGFNLKGVRLTIKHTLTYKNGEVFQEPQTITVLKPNQDFTKVTSFVKGRLKEISEIQDQGQKRQAFEDLKESLSVVALPFDILDEKNEVILSKDFDYGYAHTIHKSQGGTYKYVFVDNMRMSIKDKKTGEWVITPDAPQLRYVGMTRAQEGAYVLTDGNLTQGKPYKGKVEPSRDESSVVVPEAVVASQNTSEPTGQEASATPVVTPTTNKTTEPTAEAISKMPESVFNKTYDSYLKLKSRTEAQENTMTLLVQEFDRRKAATTQLTPTPTQTTSTPNVDPDTSLEDVDTDGLVEEDFTGPEKPTSLMSYFKDLISHTSQRFTNYFYKSFVLPEEGKESSRLLGNDSPVEYVSNLLFGSKEQIERVLGRALKYDYTNKTKAAYQRLLNPNKVKGTFGGVVFAINRNLNHWLDQPYSKKDTRPRRELLLAGVALNTFKTGKGLNIVENNNGELAYNQELIEGAVLAGMQWLLDSGSREILLKDEDIKKITGLEVDEVDEATIASLKQGFSHDQIKLAITQKIKSYWGVRNAPGALQGYSDGIPEAIAAEVLEAFIQNGLIKEVNINIRTPVLDANFNPVMDEKGEPVINAQDVNRYVVQPMDEDLNTYPTAIEDIAVVEPEQVIYLDDDVVPVAETRMNNPQEKNTEAQKKAIGLSQEKNKFYLNTHTVNALLAIGERGAAFLFGSGVVDLDKKPWLNINHKGTLEGKNKTTMSAFQAFEDLLIRMNSRATVLGVPMENVIIRYALNASKGGRLFMLGSHTPQASKFMRAAVATTWSTLDFNNPVHESNFKLALAQAMGVKVHNIPLADSIDLVDAALVALQPAIERFQTLHENPEANGLDYEALAQEFVEANKLLKKQGIKLSVPMTPASFNAVSEFARREMPGVDKTAFRTAVSLEADGITNGPINSIMLLTQGAFTPEFVMNLARGGISFSNKKSMAEIRLDTGLIDLYSESARNAQEAVYQKIREFQATNEKVSTKQKELLRTMKTLLPNMSYTFNNGKLELQFERGLLKNPLTITIYGSSANGIAGKVVGELLEAYYEKLSKAKELMTRGTRDEEGNVTKPATFAEAMFPELSAESAQEAFDRLQADMDSLLHSGIRMDYEYGKKVYSITGMIARDPSQTDVTNSKYTINARQFAVLRQTMLNAFVEPMVDGINSTLGSGLTSTVERIKTVSQIQSGIYAAMFKRELDNLIAAREEAYKAQGQSYKQNGFITKADFNMIVKKLRKYEPTINKDDQTFSLYKSKKLDKTAYSFSESLFNRFATSPNLNMPANAGVGAIPAIAIGFGDAFMIQDAVLSEVLENVLYVFDGVEMPVDKISEYSEQLNKSVYESYKANPMSNLSVMFNTFLSNPEEIKNFLASELSRVNGKTTKDLEEQAPVIHDLVRALYKKPGMSYTIFKPKAPFPTNLVDQIMGALLVQQTGLTAVAEDIDFRHQAMREVGMSVDQMAGAGAPYYNDKPLLNTSDPAEIARLLNDRYYALVNAAEDRKAALKKKNQPQKPKTFGVTVYNGEALKKLGLTFNMSKVQKLMYAQIVQSKALRDTTVITGSFRDINTYLTNMGMSPVVEKEGLKGIIRFAPDGGKVVVLIDPNPETFVHELIHATTIDIVKTYFENPASVDPEVAKAVENIYALMEEFLAETESTEAIENAKAAIYNHLIYTDATSKAYALNEFMAWALANKSLNKTLGNRQTVSKMQEIATKVVKYLKQVLGFKNKNTWLDNLQFNTAVLMHESTSLSKDFRDMEHRVGGTNPDPRLARIRDALVQNMIEPLSVMFTPTQVIVTSSNARDIDKATTFTNEVAQAFNLSDEERLTFNMFVLAMTTQGKLDSNLLTRAQELYTHVIKDMDALKLGDPTIQDAQQREANGAPKFDILLGKTGFTDAAERTAVLSAFLGLAVVNEDFRKVLSGIAVPKTSKVPGKTLNAKAENLGNQFMDGLSKFLISEKKAPHVKAAIDSLVDQLHGLTYAEKTKFELGVAKAGGLLNNTNDWVVKKKDKAAEKIAAAGDKLLGSNNLIKKIGGGVLKTTAAIASSKEGNETAEAIVKNLNKTEFKFGKRTLIDMIGRTESNSPIYDLIKPARAMVQQIRQQFRERIPKYIAGKFSRTITQQEYATVFRALGKTDFASLLSVMSVTDAVKLFLDVGARDDMISQLEEQITAKDPNNWLLLQKKMKQLANYMNTEVTGNRLLRNAEAISELLGENQVKSRKAPDKAFVEAVDKLVTLYAMQSLNQKDKDSMSSLVQNETAGIEFIAYYLKEQRSDEMKKMTGETKYNYFKGHLPSDPKADGDLIVADDNDAAKLAIYGYKKVGAYKAHPNDPVKSKRSYYFSPTTQKSAVSQGIVQNVQHTVFGVDSARGFSTGKTGGRITDPVLVANIAKRMQDTNNVENLMPLYTAEGDLYAFERSLDPKMLDKLDRSQHIAKMIGVWRGRQVEEIESLKLNQKLVSNLKEMWMKAKLTPGDESDFVNLDDPRDLSITEREVVKLFSSSMKKLVKEEFGDEPFYVRKDMLIDIIGYRNASVGDFITGNTEWGNNTQKAVKTVMLAAFGDKAFSKMIWTEQRIQTVMTDARQTIVVKSIIIPMYNIMSNMLHLVSRGVPLNMIAKGSLQKMSEINHYTKSKIRQTEIEAEIRAEQNDTKRRRLETELESIKSSHRRMSIWPLLEAGEFSTVADVGMTADDLEITSGRLSEWVEKKIEKLPPALQTAAKYGYVSRDTALFRGLQKAVQYGDFVSKAVLYDHLLENKGMTKEQALAQITEEFVNYDRLPGRDRGALENLGLLWFYNYKLRTVKVALSVLRNNPLHALIAMSLPMPNGIGTVETDNLIAGAAQGNLSYSIGPSMALHAINLNPTVNLFN